MSFSTQFAENPAKLRLSFKADSIIYYDKERGEEVSVPTPFKFVVLDERFSVGGFSDAEESNIWSNEAKSVKNDRLTVRTKNGTVFRGLYADAKAEVVGAKYVRVAYIMHDTESGPIISKLLVSGAALKAWMEFVTRGVAKNNKIVLSGFEAAKKGSVNYFVPKFEKEDLTAEDRENGTRLDGELQEYFKSSAPSEADVQAETPKDVVLEDIDDKPIDLSEIPF